MTNATVDGVEAARVVTPGDVGELSALLAADPDEAVVFVGNRTKLDWGRPPRRLDTVVDLSGLPKFVEHAAGDLVVRVSASVGLANLNGELALAGQRLALDEVVPGTTIGGLIATGISGPLRFAFGSVRDLLIGITVVRADGKVARSGGRVVKNVAGYDLGKLYTGSYGTLGAITEAHFRLHPLPTVSSYLTANWSDPALAAIAVRHLAASTLAPTAIELERDGSNAVEVTVLLEGSERSVAVRADQLEAVTSGRFAASPQPPEGFGQLPGVSTLKLSFAPGKLALLLDLLGRTLPKDEELPPDSVLRGQAAVGVLFLGVGAEHPLDGLLHTARSAATACGGTAIVLRAPTERRESLDLFGPLPAPGLQQALKASFDPTDRLAPGRFVGAV